MHFSQWFRWFDLAAWDFFERSGFSIPDMIAKYGTAGLPIVSVAANLMAPARAHERLTIETAVGAWQRKTLEMRYRFRRSDTVVLEGRETRVWVLPDRTRPNGMRAADIPPEVLAHFRALPLP